MLDFFTDLFCVLTDTIHLKKKIQLNLNHKIVDNKVVLIHPAQMV